MSKENSKGGLTDDFPDGFFDMSSDLILNRLLFLPGFPMFSVHVYLTECFYHTDLMCNKMNPIG